MPIFRATVWHTSSMVEAVDGYNPHRYVTELSADDESQFIAMIRDQYIHDVDAIVEIGPITKKDK